MPGDKIIFQSNLADEQTGEIPSQFTLIEGQADVQSADGENVIHINKGQTTTFTDNTGNAAHNLTLSQQRAEAVKVQLVSMGIDVMRHD